MYFEKKWFYGTVIVTQTDSQNTQEKRDFSESDEEPLCRLVQNSTTIKYIPSSDNEDPFQDVDVEDFKDPDYVTPTKKRRNKNLTMISPVKESSCKEQHTLSFNLEQHESMALDSNVIQTVRDKTSIGSALYQEDCFVAQHCEVNGCKDEVFSVCVRCYIVLCWDHFKNDVTCDRHREVPIVKENQPEKEQNRSISSNETICMDSVVVSPERPDNTQSCEVVGCKKEAFTSCFHCQALLCMSHYENQSSCNDHFSMTQILSNIENAPESPSLLFDFEEQNRFTEIDSPRLFSRPEHYEVEGSPREVDRTEIKKSNLRKQNKELKSTGKEHITCKSNKTIPAKRLGPICDIEICKKYNKECYLFDENTREDIFLDYWAQGNLQSQREFISRHIQKVPTKRKTAGPQSRRQFTFNYTLSLRGVPRPICKKLFLNTLNIGEMTARTAVIKTMDSGIVEKDRRGGRKDVYLEKDEAGRRMITDHINQFPRVESHYCRQNTTREYLNGDITLSRMYQMFLDEQADNNQKPCFTLYCKVFHSMNLSFHKPKKDQCGLCLSYYEGSEEVKTKLRRKFMEHYQEKVFFRAKRAECKNKSQQNSSNVQCATFDLQQVISIPISNENAVFYKRRLSVYNFTIYDMTTGECFCYTWHEGESKRGACEISTALYHFLKKSDDRGVKKVYLFADACSGQNKNTITAATMMYVINNCCNIEEIVLRFSVPGHGQNEGDSAHSAINYAIKKSGNIFVPSQLLPVFKLARRKKPYEVISLQYSDMLDFKKIANDLKLLSLRTDNTSQKVNWTEMVTFQVSKKNPAEFVFNTTHADTIPRKISLKRNVSNIFRKEVPALHSVPPKIAKEKYDDLLSLTTGDTPLIKLQEYINFYKNLPH